jgi:multiple antibiotic resistance protein
MTAAFELFIAFAVQLFIIVDPVAGVPVFLAITPDNSRDERVAMARRGCLVAFTVTVFFILAGPALLGYFGIGTAAVRIGGGVLLFVIALEMLYGRVTGTETSQREERLAQKKEDISITPLAIPLLAGPGTITTALIFSGRAEGVPAHLALLLAAAAVFALGYLFLRQADPVMKVIGRLGMAVITRILGLILAFLAVQYIIDGVRTVLAPLS